MLGNLGVFLPKYNDAVKLIAFESHTGATRCGLQMEQYTWKRWSNGIIFDS